MESLLAALGLVFVAELGDKTQLVAVGMGARHRLAPVLAGVTIAYMATNLLSVAVGGLLGATLPTRAIGLGGGVLFLAFAAWTLRSGDAAGDEDEAGGNGDTTAGGGRSGEDGGNRNGKGVGWTPGDRSVVRTVAGAMFVAELGDKTMLATATLAAQGNPVLVWVGATCGITASGSLGVLLGRVFGARLPERVTRIGSAILFAAFGLALIVTNLP